MHTHRTLLALALAGLALSACGVGGDPAERAAAAPSPGALSSRSSGPAGAGSSSQAVATPTGTPAAAERCRTGQLKVDAGHVQATASTRSLVLGLTNVGTVRCTITGFGGLALLDARGTQLQTRFERTITRPRTVDLAPQGHTTRTITWRVVPEQNTDPTADCVAANALLVTPPDEEPADLVVHEPITACRGGTITGAPWDRDAG